MFTPIRRRFSSSLKGPLGLQSGMVKQTKDREETDLQSAMDKLTEDRGETDLQSGMDKLTEDREETDLQSGMDKLTEDRQETDLQSGMDNQTKHDPPLSFPNNLEGFGYAFNEQGQLRHVKTGEAFVFKVREDDPDWNQKHYEALGEVLNQHVFELLEKKCNMTRVTVPVDATDNEPSSFIFLSPDALTNPSKLLVLIQGSGVVRAGQWARKLIINEDLDSGTQIPFIARAMEEGYGVVVLNPNQNSVEVDKPTPSSLAEERQYEPPHGLAEEQDSKHQKKGETEYIQIRENSSSPAHVLYVWDHFVSTAQAKDIFVVAHSFGGLSLVELLKQRQVEVKRRVVAVAFTDSIHNIRLQKPGQSDLDWMQKHCCNWVRSRQPLDTPVRTRQPDCPCVSAGTEEHALTSWRSFQSIFRFFNKAKRAEDGRS